MNEYIFGVLAKAMDADWMMFRNSFPFDTCSMFESPLELCSLNHVCSHVVGACPSVSVKVLK